MAHGKPKGTPNFDSRLVWITGIVAVILFFVTIVGIEAGFRFVWNHELYQKRYLPPNTKLVKLQQEQEAVITTTRWVDKQKQFAAVPIDDAIQAYVAKH